MDFQKLNEETFCLDNISIKKIQLTLPFPRTDHVSFGVDPGTVHLGLAHIYNGTATVYEIHMPRQNTITGKIDTIYKIMDNCSGAFNYWDKGIIEGASYADKYRQVELAEIRTIAAFWFRKHYITPIIVPPTTIRKAVMGSGKTKPESVWTDIPPNAANALACAIYSRYL